MRGSVDGYKGQSFLNKCKNEGKTITIVKTDDEKVLGLFTDLNFDGSGSWIKGNKNSFLFEFLDNKVIKCKCVNNKMKLLPQEMVIF